MKEVQTVVNGIETTLYVDDEEAKRIESQSSKRAKPTEHKARKGVDNKSA